MTTINDIILCHICNRPLGDSANTAICPHCGHIRISAENPAFQEVDYISIQYHDQCAELDLPAKRASSRERENKLNELEYNFHKWGRECSDDDRIGAMEDAYLMITELLHTQTNLETKRKVISLGLAIGEAAGSIESCVKNGVSVNHVLTIKRIPPAPGNPVSSTEATS